MTNPLPPDLAASADLLRRAAADESPPAAVRARAVALDDAAHRLARRGSALLRRLVAVALPADSGGGFAPACGVRGAAAAGQHWLFKAEECEIDLRVLPQGEKWIVAGQIFGVPQAQRVVLEGAAPQAGIDLGPTREFTFGGLTAGSYRLTVQGGDCEIVIPRFDIGATDSMA
jgi:hypothetical protein